MTREDARRHLQSGGQLDGIVTNAAGIVLARGKVQWEGTQLICARDGAAEKVQLSKNGDHLTVPLVHRVTVHMGTPLDLQFDPAKWGRAAA